jgi:Flp pilus assembly pilin Flp
VLRRALWFEGPPARTPNRKRKPAPQDPKMQTRRLSKLDNSLGQTMTEYAFILAFIVLVVIVAIPIFTNVVVSLFDSVMSGFGS